MEERSPRRAMDPWVFELVLELLLWPALVGFAAFYAVMGDHIGYHADLLIVGACVFLGAFWIATIILPSRKQPSLHRSTGTSRASRSNPC